MGRFWAPFGQSQLWTVAPFSLLKLTFFWHVIFVTFWSPLRRPKRRPRGPKRLQDPPKDGPRGAQETPRPPQERPKRLQEAAKSAPGGSKKASRDPKSRSRGLKSLENHSKRLQKPVRMLNIQKRHLEQLQRCPATQWRTGMPTANTPLRFNVHRSGGFLKLSRQSRLITFQLLTGE